jgi:quinol monooxygenase YgiN
MRPAPASRLYRTPHGEPGAGPDAPKKRLRVQVLACGGPLSDRPGAHSWSSLQDTSPLSRSSASPTSRAVCASSNRLAGQLAASTSRICADLVDPGRVNIFERWESQAALETFRSSGPDTEQRRAMLTVSVQEYPIADVRAVFGEGAE